MSGWRMNNAAVLHVAGLNAWYGESHVLHGVDFSVNGGEVVTLLGRNGAGRTSTLRAILGLTGKRAVVHHGGLRRGQIRQSLQTQAAPLRPIEHQPEREIFLRVG